MLPGSAAQLVFGLIVCFVTSCAYSAYSPLREPSDNYLQQLAQFEIFFFLLSSIIDEWMQNDEMLDVVCTVLLFAPPAVAITGEIVTSSTLRRPRMWT